MHVSILMVRALAGVIERSGASRELFLREARIDPQWIEEGTRRLPLGDYLRAVDAALKVSGDPALGLRLGEQARASMFHLLGPMTEQARTLRETIDTMRRYARLMAENNAPELLETDGTASLRFPTLQGDQPLIRLTAEFAMAAFLSSLKLFVGDGVLPSEVRFAFPEPPYSAEYRRIFSDRVVFGSATTEMVFPREWLDKTQPYGSRELYEVLKEQAERSLDRLERDAPLRERIEQVIAKHGARLPPMDEVARELGMSARSLRRRMQSEGLSYSDLVARTRMQVAKRMLERPGASIQEAAFALGFASPAAFHRAFKRWTGLTPKQYQDSF